MLEAFEYDGSKAISMLTSLIIDSDVYSENYNDDNSSNSIQDKSYSRYNHHYYHYYYNHIIIIITIIITSSSLLLLLLL